MSERPSQTEYHLALAVTAGWRSCCVGREVGAVLVRDNRVLSIGCNGTPLDWAGCEMPHQFSEYVTGDACPHCVERQRVRSEQLRREELNLPPMPRGELQGRSEDSCICVHAEANAILTAARYGTSLDGATAYLTDLPCVQCAKELLQVGVRRLFYLREPDPSDPANQLGEAALIAQYQLMRRLSAEKYRASRVVDKLSGYLAGAERRESFTRSLRSSGLHDDQVRLAQLVRPAED